MLSSLDASESGSTGDDEESPSLPRPPSLSCFLCSKTFHRHLGGHKTVRAVGPLHFPRPHLCFLLFLQNSHLPHPHSDCQLKGSHIYQRMTPSPWKPRKNEHEAEGICVILDLQPGILNVRCLTSFNPALISASACPGAHLEYRSALKRSLG